MASFRAMSTQVNLLCPLQSPREEQMLAHFVEELFQASERRFSRFREDSELSHLNRDPELQTSSSLTAALARAEQYRQLTDGLFDVRVGQALHRCGYDRSFQAGALDRAEPIAAQESEPAHLLDLGGMIKGHTVDRARALLPACSVLDAGGDIALVGAGPDGRGWPVEIEDPRDAEATLLTLRLGDCAVATSAKNRRTWQRAGEQQHHLIDPRTQRPSQSDLLQATVVANSTELAEVLAKAAFVGGSEVARRLMRVCDTSGVFVREDGSWFLVGQLEVDRGE